jgi:hypothetical protein
MNKVIFNNVWKSRVCNPIFNIINTYVKKHNIYDLYQVNFLLMSKEIINKFQEANKLIFEGKDWKYVNQNVFEGKINASSYEQFLIRLFLGAYDNNHVVENLIFTNFKKPVYRTNIFLHQFIYNVDYQNNLLNIKYDKTIGLIDKFRLNEFQDNGNSELYMIFPYFLYNNVTNNRRYGSIQQNNCYKNLIYSPILNKKVPQFNFIALKISDMNGDGDVKFDHADKIDYIDSLNITIKVPYAL